MTGTTFTFSKGQFDVPEGKYACRFLGIKMLDDTGAKDKDGKPLPPAMAWEFQVSEGEHAGKKVDRVTGRQPPPRSGCGKMLAAVTDQILKDGQQYDINGLIGQPYRVTVEEKPTGNGTRVSDNPAPVRMYGGPPSNPAPRPATAASAPADGHAASDTPARLEVMIDDDWCPLTREQIAQGIKEGTYDADALKGRDPATKEKKLLREWGFSNVPF